MDLLKYYYQLPGIHMILYVAIKILWYKVYLKVLWFFNGVTAHKNRINSGEEKVLVAQVLDVVFRLDLKCYFVLPPNVLLTHRKFASIAEMKTMNITLQSVLPKKNYAYLAVFADNDNAYDTKRHPFLSVSQNIHAMAVIKLPLNEFYKMVEDIDVGSKQLIVMSHTLRCGSTVWAQVFNAVPKWGVISDNQTVTKSVIEEYNDFWTFAKTAEYERMVVAIVKFYIASFPDKEGVFIKLGPVESYMLSIIAKHFPQAKFLFGYRDPLPSGKSWHHVMQLIDPSLYFFKAMSLDPTANHMFVRFFKYSHMHGYGPGRDIMTRVKPASPFEWYMIFRSVNTRLTLDIKELGVEVKGVKYETFMEDKKRVIAKVFQYAGIDEEHVDDALRAIEIDSQAGTLVSHELRQSLGQWQRNNDSICRANEILSYFGFPDVDSGYDFPDNL